MTANRIARLTITLNGVSPAVTRQVEVPIDTRLDRLHLIIQAAMGWTNSHLYEIRAGQVRWSSRFHDADWEEESLDASKARLADVIEDWGVKTFRYLYDFGDGWDHKVKIERLIDPEPGVGYPHLVSASGRCPPEDIGGPWGYEEFLAAISDPAHERHAEFMEWLDDEFNPDDPGREALTAAVDALAKPPPRKAAKKSARRS